MLREAVADHYRAKGYSIRERAQIRGDSGSVHTVDMVAMGPLGNLIIALEDEGGFEGPEMNAVRRAARDVGATPVMAARKIPEGLRRAAADAGVVLLDEDTMDMETVDAPVTTTTIEYEPWPDTARRDDDDTPAWPGSRKTTDAGIWRYPRGGDEKREGFDWLKTQPSTEPEDEPIEAPLEVDMAAAVGASRPARIAGIETASTTAPAVRAATARMGFDWRWAVVGLIAGASAGGVFYAFSRILG